MENRLNRYPFLMVNALSLAKYHKPYNRYPSELFKEMLMSPEGKTGRFLAMTHMVEKVVPGFEENMNKLLLSFKNLPIKIEEIEYLGSGGEQNVFKIQTDGKIHALKIHKLSQVCSGCNFNNQIKIVREEYEMIRNWYGHIDGFIPEEVYFVGHSPVLNVSALMTLQPYVDKQMIGVFEDFTAKDFVSYLNIHDDLRESYWSFAKKLIWLWENEGKCIDVLGVKNLCVLVDKGCSPELYFGDPHIIFDIVKKLPERCDWGRVQSRLDNRIAWIRETLIE